MERKVMWTMKNGQKINVDDMSETHAKNSLKMLIKRVEAWRKEINQTKPQWLPNGEFALEDADKYALYEIDPELTCCCDEHHVCQQCWERMDYLR
jgi:hypothetical protein